MVQVSEVLSTSWTVAHLKITTAIVLLSVLNSLDRDGSSCHRDKRSVVDECILDRDGRAVIAANVTIPSKVCFKPVENNGCGGVPSD